MKARYPSYMKHSRIWKYILLGLLAAVLVPFGLFAYGNYMTTYYNGLDYPWRYPDTVWRSEEPHAEIAVDGDERATWHLEVDGEMQGDVALMEEMRRSILPDSTLNGSANLLVMPNVEAANISYNLLRVSAADGVTIGPILMGLNKPVHILTPISSVRRIINMVAVAAVEAQRQDEEA